MQEKAVGLPVQKVMIRQWLPDFLDSLAFAFVAAVLLGAIGCAPKTRHVTNPQAASSEHGFALIDVGVDAVEANAVVLTSMPLPEPAKGHVGNIHDAAKVIRQGKAESKKACDAANKRNDDNDRADALVYRKWLIAGAIIAALAITAMIALQTAPIPAWVKGLGHAVFGGAIALMAIMLGLREVGRFMWIVTPVAAVIVCVALVVIVATLLKQWLAMRKEKQINREMVKSAAVALEHVPEYAKPAVYDTIEKIQSPVTKQMVSDVKANEPAAEAVPPPPADVT